MAVIKTLSQLSISRPGSQASAHRHNSNSSLSGSTLTQTTPPTPSDYYLPDEDLTDHQPRRSRSHGGVSRKSTADPNAPLAPPPPVPPTASAQTGKPRRTLSLGPSLSMGGRSRVNAGHSTLATSMMTANGAATPSNAGGAHGLLSSKTAPSANDAVAHPAPTTTPLGTPGSPFEAGYVGKIGQTLRDLVNRTFPSAPEAGLAWKGRAAPRAAVAAEFAELIKGEMLLTASDPYLLRSLLRTAILPALTVYQTRLDVLLIAPMSEPMTLYIPKSARDVDALPVPLRFNVEVVKAAWVVRNAIEAVAPAHDENQRGQADCIRPFAGKLDAIIQRLMGPYLAVAKPQLMAKIAKLRDPDPASRPSTPAATKGLPMALTRSNPAVATPTMVHLPAGTPDRLRDLAVSLDALKKLFMVKLACGADSRKWMVSVASQAVWKGMLAFAARPVEVGHDHPKSPPSPPRVGVARGLLRGGQRSPSPTQAGRLTAHHHLHHHHHHHHHHQRGHSRKDLLAELATFSLIIRKFVEGIAQLPDPGPLGSPLECPNGPACEFCGHGLSLKAEDDGDLVRDAMKEALEALSASELALLAVARPAQLVPALLPLPPPPAPLTVSAAFALGPEDERAGVGQDHGPAVAPYCPTLDRALDELPPLILLHGLAAGLSSTSSFQLPNEKWEETWEEYEDKLKGFVAAEEWTGAVAAEMRGQAESLLSQEEEGGGGLDRQILEVVKLVGEAMAGGAA